MGRKLKVYGGLVFRDGKQRRAVVAAYSQKEVAAIIDQSVGYVRDFWAVTGNEKEIADAMQNPGTLNTYPRDTP